MSASPVNPGRYTQLSTSPVFPLTASPLDSRANRVAKNQLSEPSSSSSIHLTGDKSQAYDFHKKLSEAYQLLHSQEYEIAKKLFEEVQSEYRESGCLEKMSFIGAHCYLGIAYSLPDEGTAVNSKVKAVSDALESLTLIFINKKYLNQENPELKSKAYCQLRSCYKLLLPLIPKTETKKIKEIQANIAKCSKFILPAHEFQEKVQEADRYAAKKEPVRARQIYKEALCFKLDSSPRSLIACAACYLNYASTYSSRNSERTLQLAEADKKLHQLYDQKEHLDGQLANLVRLYMKLLTLMPEEPREARLEIQRRVEICKAALTNQKKPDVSLGRRIVSKILNGPKKPAEIFARFLILTLAAVGVIALVRRFIRRLA